MKNDQTNPKAQQNQHTLQGSKPNLDSSAEEPLLSKLGSE
jgi:hypothetical protein